MVTIRISQYDPTEFTLCAKLKVKTYGEALGNILSPRDPHPGTTDVKRCMSSPRHPDTDW